MAKFVGKVVANAAYLIPENIETLPFEYVELIQRANTFLDASPQNCNVLKISPKIKKVSFLEYDDLHKEPFPTLRQSISIDLVKEAMTHRSYRTRDNPPILHRKELLLGEEHPDFEKFSLLTRTLEELGLFGETSRIGTKQEWSELLNSLGVRIDDHRVICSEKKSIDETISRHRTALVRSSLSTPIETAIKHKLITQERTLFDYGCGRGDDVALLTVEGFDAVGWDPYYAPQKNKRPSSVVNLGYVLNVIEAPSERVWVLKDAYGYAEKVLIIAALIEGQKSRTQAKRYRDGIITKRGTFQKFFAQMELRELIEASLKTEAISAGPGLFIVIRDDAEREEFLRTRHTRTSRYVLPRISSQVRRSIELTSDEDELFANSYWEIACQLGRLPRPTELPDTLSNWLIKKFGNPRKASSWLIDHFGREELERAAQQKKDQLLCYLALAVFRRKKLRSLMTPELKREIKRNFGSLKEAEAEAFQTLRNMADPETLANDCMEAWERGYSQIDAKGRLLVHAERVIELPSSLQVVIGVAEWLGDDLSSVSVVSVEPEHAIVTFYHYRNFKREPFPLLESRLRIGLIRQKIKFLPESETGSPRLFMGKSFLLGDEESMQALLDNSIREIDAQAFSLGRVTAPALLRLIGQTGKTWEGIGLGAFFRSMPKGKFNYDTFAAQVLNNAVLPSLDDNCGRHLIYRDLIECGETQQSSGLANWPKQPESFGGLQNLASQVLDPVIDEYGMIKLTYGFSSPELTKKIPARIAPRLDQHSAYEKNSRGKLICTRQGAAVDFVVEYESMLEVSQWIVVNCNFDRIYFYGDNRPIHVSVGPERNRAVIIMKPRRDGREGPQKIEIEKFISLDVSNL